ncbi:pyrroloquinoline quinone biosynthesis peptide chaperone PqqD [Nitrospirillum sp. BR 11164]|uniref:pyrroloquinoline quinone biosynthesis peptide chaperone PqqD n=1 Tax=Nitrospirillum sp. BR 11164 TaxID=3104324 RepID=UPI002AFEF574|nr:pyrroloquinoline quinone biosynthesis peptide chaperone PqqD [Nitrospirillum sp. BR 11164]MEA1648833.1 pyrroloquinoline quinone biosynthesis peptide chaperone PqqD [Nitrospirillum sp. BR 11164]
MTAALEAVGQAVVPRFARGVKFRFDETRQSWMVLAPERLFLPDEAATEILKLVDGQRSLGAIIDDLATRFGVPRDEMAGDVGGMLRDLAEKGVVLL